VTKLYSFIKRERISKSLWKSQNGLISYL